MTLGQFISCDAGRKNIEIEEAASLCGVTVRTFQDWEADITVPTVEMIAPLASATGTPIEIYAQKIKEAQENHKQKVIEVGGKSTGLPAGSHYRPAFVSRVVLNSAKHSDIDNGYAEGRSHFDNVSIFFNNLEKMKPAMADKNYAKCVLVQTDLLVYFFIDNVRKVFGFYFDGAEQFVCPYENYVDLFVQTSGVSSYIGRPNAFLEGMYSDGTLLSMPSKYTLTFGYCLEDGKQATYTIVFECTRSYRLAAGVSDCIETEELQKRLLSKSTKSGVEQIKALLEGVKSQRDEILVGGLTADPLDYVALEGAVEAGAKAREEITNVYVNKGETSHAVKMTLTIFLVLVVIVGCIIFIAVLVNHPEILIGK